ncbi:response regulator [Agrococcus sp. SGAir0287]|uniref:response regulator n=1 Tax=Agrococcus sp. SGAir0287 TaxID=2070347 RepID=UPI0010CD5935|nr:response regulator [Agrococcus sp. SGAir0287]QCR19401.1 response regulator [Agrococcus sp. SGAir0287]
MTAALAVLVVDDVADQRELLRTHLEQAGCTVRTCGDLDAVDAALRRERIDAAIVDLLMPGDDGWAVADRIRERSPSTIVAFASVLDAADHPEGELALPKPFTGEQVRALLARVRERMADAGGAP